MTALPSSHRAARVAPQVFGRARGSGISCIIYFFGAWMPLPAHTWRGLIHLGGAVLVWNRKPGSLNPPPIQQLKPTPAAACFFFDLANSTRVYRPGRRAGQQGLRLAQHPRLALGMLKLCGLQWP